MFRHPIELEILAAERVAELRGAGPTATGGRPAGGPIALRRGDRG